MQAAGLFAAEHRDPRGRSQGGSQPFGQGGRGAVGELSRGGFSHGHHDLNLLKISALEGGAAELQYRFGPCLSGPLAIAPDP